MSDLTIGTKNAAIAKFEFMKLPHDEKTAEEILRYVKTLRYKNVIVIGMGGAMLGGKTLVEALRSDGAPEFTFMDNIDPDYFSSALKNINLEDSIIVVASKSGNTIETIANFAALKKLMKKNKVNCAGKTIIITENNDNPLNRIAKKEKIRQFNVSKNTVGRFSALGPMGLIPAALAKIDIKKILAGARDARAADAAKLAAIQYSAYKKHNKPITVIFPYSSKLNSFADWYIQLLSESIGKKSDVGPTPIKAIGAIDQHSQLQLFMDGPKNKFIIFIEIEKFKNSVGFDNEILNESALECLKNKSMSDLISVEKRAIETALATKKVPNITIKLKSLNEENLGRLLQLLEMQIALLGKLFKVNAFDQPGVELGKNLTKKYLSNAKNQKTAKTSGAEKN